MWNAVNLIRNGGYLGSIAHSNSGGFEFALNTPQITKFLPHTDSVLSGIRKTWEVKDYGGQTLEEKIAAVEQTIDSVTKHEFYHLIQFMDESELMDKAVKKSITSLRLVATHIVSMIGTSIVLPEYAIPIAGLQTLLVVGVGSQISKGGIDKVEKEAYAAQRKAKEIDLVKRPFTYIHESDQKK